MSFPALEPTSRSFEAGDFPVKAFSAQDGSEIRFLYGNRRVGMKMSLTYQNVSDANAGSFIAHFQSMQGTYQTFRLPAAARGGWKGSSSHLDAEAWGSLWRYSSAPKVDSVYPGISTATVTLISATI